MRRISVSIEDRVKEEISPFLSYGIVIGVNIRESDEEIIREIREIENLVRSRFPSIDSIRENRIIRALRDFYWRIKIDPTKQRPSSEALIRRILRGKGIPLINNVVDIGNIVSIKTLIPIGIYDLDKISGDYVILRYSRDGEVFHPIGGEPYQLSGEPCISDSEKIIHVYPHRDSEITKVTWDTKNLLIISCGVPGIEYKVVDNALSAVTNMINKLIGGETIMTGRVI